MYAAQAAGSELRRAGCGAAAEPPEKSRRAAGRRRRRVARERSVGSGARCCGEAAAPPPRPHCLQSACFPVNSGLVSVLYITRGPPRSTCCKVDVDRSFPVEEKWKLICLITSDSDGGSGFLYFFNSVVISRLTNEPSQPCAGSAPAELCPAYGTARQGLGKLYMVVNRNGYKCVKRTFV